MSRLYKQYQECKERDNTKLYLFKSGLFYLFIGQDAIDVSNMTTLRCTKLTEDVMKCGFPVNALDKYISIFTAIGVDLVLVDEQEVVVPNKEYLKNEKVLSYINFIKKMDTNRVTPMEAFNLLIEFKDVLGNE